VLSIDAGEEGKRPLHEAVAVVGMAWWYRAYAGERTPQARRQYEFAEKEARAKHAGLWADPEPTPPCEWRRVKRASSGQ
jgi:endonuclease YncB( thermonuclease family)